MKSPEEKVLPSLMLLPIAALVAGMGILTVLHWMVGY
jgi:hypothetical protein